MAALHLGRVVMDARGIRRERFLGLFGQAFDLEWSGIVGWAVGADVIKTHQYPEGMVVARILELDHAGGTVVIRWGRSEPPFVAFAVAVGERLPNAARPPRVGQRFDSRLPEPLARFAGLHREP